MENVRGYGDVTSPILLGQSPEQSSGDSNTPQETECPQWNHIHAEMKRSSETLFSREISRCDGFACIGMKILEKFIELAAMRPKSFPNHYCLFVKWLLQSHLNESKTRISTEHSHIIESHGIGTMLAYLSRLISLTTLASARLCDINDLCYKFENYNNLSLAHIYYIIPKLSSDQIFATIYTIGSNQSCLNNIHAEADQSHIMGSLTVFILAKIFAHYPYAVEDMNVEPVPNLELSESDMVPAAQMSGSGASVQMSGSGASVQMSGSSVVAQMPQSDAAMHNQLESGEKRKRKYTFIKRKRAGESNSSSSSAESITADILPAEDGTVNSNSFELGQAGLPHDRFQIKLITSRDVRCLSPSTKVSRGYINICGVIFDLYRILNGCTYITISKEQNDKETLDKFNNLYLESTRSSEVDEHSTEQSDCTRILNSDSYYIKLGSIALTLVGTQENSLYFTIHGSSITATGNIIISGRNYEVVKIIRGAVIISPVSG